MSEPASESKSPPTASSPNSATAVYVDAELGGRVGFGERPAILVVDFQRSFTDPTIVGGGDFTDAIDATGTLLGCARDQRLPIVFTTVAYSHTLADAGRFLDKCPALRFSIEGTPMVEVDGRLERRSGELVVVKKYASAFFGTALHSFLTTTHSDTVVVCGCTTSGCVRATVVDAMQYGYRAIVPRECVADIAPEPHEANLFDIDAKYGDVVSLNDVLYHLGSAAALGRD